MKLPSRFRLPCLALAALSVLLGCQPDIINASQDASDTSAAATNSSATGAPDPTTLTISDMMPASTNTPPAKGAPPVALPAEVQKIVEMAESGVSDDVLLAYINNAPINFSMSPEQVVYLSDVGLPENVITAIINHHPVAQEVAQQPPPIIPQIGVSSSAPAPVYQEQPQQPPPPDPTQVQQVAPVAVAVAPPPEITYNSFYTTLSPYGSWVLVDGYGWCWQPTVAVIDSGWRPYCDRGRWIYSDCGWYWQSYYSWGWAPFHYGRWFSHPHRGWVWAPDLTWGPSWVSWRYSDAYCGWAPLPPGAYIHAGGLAYHGVGVGVSFGFGLGVGSFTFIESRHFCDPYPWHHYVPRSHVVNIYNNTTVINNYAQSTVNKTVINHGVDPNRIAAASHTEIRKVHVREVPSGGGARPDRVAQDGSQLVVYRPQAPGGAGGSNSRGPRSAASLNSSSLLAPASSGLVASREPSASARPLVPHADYSVRRDPSSVLPRSEARYQGPSSSAALRSTTDASVARPLNSRGTSSSGAASSVYQPQIIRTPTEGLARQETVKPSASRSELGSRIAPSVAESNVRQPTTINRIATPEVFRGSSSGQTVRPTESRPAVAQPYNSAAASGERISQFPSRGELIKPSSPSTVQPTYRSQEIFSNRGVPYTAPSAPAYSPQQIPNRPMSVPQRGYSSPVYNAPSATPPSYSAPAAPSYRAPAYNPPAYTPQPSYPSRGSYTPAPSRSYSAPAPAPSGSVSTRSEYSAPSPRSATVQPGTSRTRSWQ